jgi:sec-independent protein translocase protein TatA
MIGSQDLLIALAIGLVMFGAKKLPELARGLGESVKEFKKGIATEPDPVPSTEPQSPAALAPPLAPARHCANCQASLQADWTHCPKCGTPFTNTG